MPLGRFARQREQFPPQSCDLADRCYRPSKKPALLPSGGRFAGPEHDDFGADWRAVVEIDDDRSRPLVRRVGDDLAGEGGIRPSRLFPRHRKNAGIGRPAYTGYQSEQHGACRTPYDLP